MKKKTSVTSKDQKDWDVFTKEMSNITDKESIFFNKKIKINKINKIKKLDLHGSSLIEANQIIEKFIIESFNDGYKKLLIITGKGLRSQSHDNPHLSKKLSTLKYSVPEYIMRNANLRNKVSEITKASLKDGGEGAIYIFLKNKKNL